MCDTMVVVGPGRVLFAKNSDRDPNEAQLLDWQPRRDWPAGCRLRCTWVEIPQAARTHAVLLSRPFWMWGAEMGANEHGVVIGNEAVFTSEPYARTGLTGMDLLRLALERAGTALEACDVIAALLERHGQGGGCGLENKNFTYHNSFLIADRQEAWVLETAGRHWARERVEGVRTISNGLGIAGFAEQYSDRLRTRVAGCRLRQRRTQQLAGGGSGPRDLFAALRDHGAGRRFPHYSLVNGGLRAPCVHAGGLIASSQTTASWVADLRPGSCLHWVTATSSPCLSLFKPVRVEEPLAAGQQPTDRADEQTLWWRHERLSRRVVTNPEQLMPAFEQQRDAVEAEWLANPPDSPTAFARGDALLEEWSRAISARSVKNTLPFWVRACWARRNRWAGLDLHG
jgi:dipeptidase